MIVLPEKIRKTMLMCFGVVILFFFASTLPSKALADDSKVLGIHILHPSEINEALDLFSFSVDVDEDELTLQQKLFLQKSKYVTIPLRLDELNTARDWQIFLYTCKQRKVIPIVRLMTSLENNTWKRPTRKEIVDQIAFLSKLNWPYKRRYIIVYNEVNHAKEWGGKLDPAGYAQTLKFTSQWAKTEPVEEKFYILPAAMDLAAPNSDQTMDAFLYLRRMMAAEREIFDYIDFWNSHSYPNPGFSSSPELTARNSMRGFLHELEFMDVYLGKRYDVFITETGWMMNDQTRQWLESYYLYSLRHIWSHYRVRGVTPFVLKGAPGPFESFSFIDASGNPTLHYQAYQSALRKYFLSLEE